MYCNICNKETKTIKHPKSGMLYHYCKECDFIIKDESHFITSDNEKKRYDTHNNDDEVYKNIFKKFIDEEISPLQVKSILDYGSGPYPVLYNQLKDHYNTKHFDPFYHPDVEYLEHTYDLICIIEVIEHMYQPRMELNKLISLLNKDGYLLIKTNFRIMDETEFMNWWYQRDETHVGFFNENTFQTIASIYNLNIIKTNNKDTILLQKQGD